MDIKRVARLARLDLNEPDLALMATQLSTILDYFDQIKQLNTDGIEPLAHPLTLQNVFRPDESAPSLSVDDALANAPSRVGDYFGVPAVFEDLSH